MSVDFTAFDPATGRVLFGGVADNPADLASPGTAIAEGINVDSGWLEDGVYFPLPPKTSPTHTFNWQTKQWEDQRTLADVKAAKNEAINRARAAANTSTFTFQGKPISVDALSRGDIDAAHGAILLLQALPPGWPGAWKTADNDYVPIPDVATWGLFYGAMVAAGTAHFNHAQALKAQLAAATTIAEVEALPNW